MYHTPMYGYNTRFHREHKIGQSETKHVLLAISRDPILPLQMS